jgi:NTE family protein
VPPPITSLPDVLVLGAGGTLGIAWLQGLLRGLEEAAGLDFSQCDYYVGTSAGSYVAAHLAAGREMPAVREMHDAAAELPAEEDEEGKGLRRVAGSGLRVAAAASAPLMPLALRASRRPGAAARALALRTARSGRPLRLGLGGIGSFDGRLRVATVDRATGGRVVFGAPGAPKASVAEAVTASCSVPWLFSPVEIGGREYVDGGVWSMSNLDAAPAGRQAEVLALLPTFGRGAGKGPASWLRAAGQAAGLAEMQILRARGLRARIVAPDAAVVAAMGPNLMSSGPRAAVVAAGRRQGRALAA